MDSLTENAFSNNVDELVDSANSVGSYCGCGMINTSFSRDNLVDPITQCTANTEYWQFVDNIDNGKCAEKFLKASYAVQAEFKLSNETESAMNELRNDALDVFQTYDTKIF